MGVAAAVSEGEKRWVYGEGGDLRLRHRWDMKEKEEMGVESEPK